MAAHGDEENAEGYVAKFEEETGWRPAHVGLFAGALLYTHYGFIKKRVMKKIASDKGSLDTDTSRDYVYTEWDGVQRFTEDFRAGLAAPSR
nr:flavodoxin domain-containing protein [Pseudarthrobacter sp. ATCC 49987]